jgi:hypothetical protein
MGKRIEVANVDGAWLEVKEPWTCPVDVASDLFDIVDELSDGDATIATVYRMQGRTCARYASWALEKWNCPGVDSDTPPQDLPLKVLLALAEEVSEAMDPTGLVAAQQSSKTPETPSEESTEQPKD